jgi:murein DD-endopeptidase MepM/ murein hydrolase activator NlpD
MARISYIYNAETCKYEPVIITGKRFTRNSVRFLGISFLLGLAGLIYFNSKYPLWDETLLKEENQRLKTEWRVLYRQLDKASQQIAALEQNDDNNYRMILDMEPLQASIRAAGVGGREKESSSIGFPLIRVAYEKAGKLKSRLDIESQSLEELNNKLADKEKMWASRPAIQPIDNKDLTHLHTTFGMREHPLLGYVRPHKGLDFTAPQGSPVYATGDGVVAVAERSASFGNTVLIRHGYSFQTRYAHLTRYTVIDGEPVKRGQVIGYVGSTGLSKGAHLHYEVLFNNEQINPINFFQRDLSNKEYDRLIELSGKSNTSLDNY